jgi:hypothetical protein
LLSPPSPSAAEKTASSEERRKTNKAAGAMGGREGFSTVAVWDDDERGRGDGSVLGRRQAQVAD